MGTPVDVATARDLAEQLLEPLGRRWLHVQGVARAAERAGDGMRFSRELVAAAWLHDIGYAPQLQRTGFHPIDAARYLQDRGWDPLVVSLVAHHTCARVEADLRGLGDQLEYFPRPPRACEDALCFCDITTGPTGQQVSAYERLSEIERRYGPGHVVTRFVGEAREEILLSVVRHLGRSPAEPPPDVQDDHAAH